MNVRRRPARRRLLGRVRAAAQSWMAFVAVLGVASLVSSSLLAHRLDSLRKQSVQLERDLATARHELTVARDRYNASSVREIVVQRATDELGLVECRPGQQPYLAWVVEEPGSRGPAWAVDLARGVNRLVTVPGVLAAEEDR